jgi:hypothetical protein
MPLLRQCPLDPRHGLADLIGPWIGPPLHSESALDALAPFAVVDLRGKHRPRDRAQRSDGNRSGVSVFHRVLNLAAFCAAFVHLGCTDQAQRFGLRLGFSGTCTCPSVQVITPRAREVRVTWR